MDRKIVFSGSIPQETDLLYTNQNTMVALAKLTQAMFGTSTIVNGLAVTAQSPAALAVNVAPGEIYELANLESTAYSSLAADLTHSIMKQGIVLDTQAISLSAPSTSGYSVNYLIEATYQDTDANAVVLPYYNSANPSQPYSGANNSGTQQYTMRKGSVVVTAKAGVATTTGSQTTPAPDSGYVGLYVVTVAYGQSTITSANISQYIGAPILPAGLLQTIQSSTATYAVDSGTAANTYKVNLTPAVTSLSDGMVIEFQPNYTNTGAATLSVNGLTAYPIVGGAHIALQGGEITAAGKVQVAWHAGLSSFVILDATAGSVQVGNGTKTQHAVAMGQLTSVVGSARNLKCSITTAASTATFTANELVVETALGGLKYQISSLSKTINLATTGAGGMDTGSAPVSGFVAVYVILNPTTGATALLGVNATSVSLPEVYGGSNMPSGYTASALISVWPTNSSGQFVVGYQQDRSIDYLALTAVTTTSAPTSISSLSIAAYVPLNAKTAKLRPRINTVSAAIPSLGILLFSSASGLGQQSISSNCASGSAYDTPTFNVAITTAQTVWWYASGASTSSISIYCSGYTF